MSLWVVRAGKYGEQEETAVKEHLVCHAWNELPDYSGCRTKDELRVLYKATYPRDGEKQVISRLGQVWRFAHEIQKWRPGCTASQDRICICIRSNRGRIPLKEGCPERNEYPQRRLA
jgi:restriction system protein